MTFSLKNGAKMELFNTKMLYSMQTTFFFRLFFPPPAAASEIFAGGNGACTGGAAYAWEAPVM